MQVHDWPNHPETAERLVSIGKALDKLMHGVHHSMHEVTEYTPALLEDVLAIHDPRYISALEEKAKRTMDTSGMMVDESTYITRSSYLDAMVSAGSVKALVDSIMAVSNYYVVTEDDMVQKAKKVVNGEAPKGFALCRPPGHHACKARPMGFCLINNAAVACKYVQNKYPDLVKNVAIIDFDVHHGNGTQDLFYSDESVLFMSMHQDGSFPGTGKISEVGLADGAGTTINIPLPGDSGNLAALRVWEDVMLPALKKFQPDFVIVSAGYDAHILDPLGGLQFSNSTYFDLTASIAEASRELCGGRCLFVLEGGYHLEALGESVANTFAAIVQDEDADGSFDQLPRDYFREEPSEKVKRIISEVKSIHSL